MHIKDFDNWNKEKQILEKKERKVYIKDREVWWCSLGINLGSEIDGKNGLYERPVLVLKILSKGTFLVLPLTTKGKEDRNHVRIKTSKITSFAVLSQMRVVSIKRFSRKVDTIPKVVFTSIYKTLLEYVSPV
jgi:mRNA interferase MazF